MFEHEMGRKAQYFWNKQKEKADVAGDAAARNKQEQRATQLPFNIVEESKFRTQFSE